MNNKAFSLVELLVAITVILLLGGILVSAITGTLRNAERNSGHVLLRDMGRAMQLYANDHGGSLPGPLWPGQVPEYDPDREGRLVVILAPYLGFPRPTSTEVVDAFVPPAAMRQADPSELASLRVYVMNRAEERDGQFYYPFGAFADANDGEGQPPLSLEQLPWDPSISWAMAEADRTHPAVSGQAWSSDTLPEPYHRTGRHVLYLDGRVEWEDVL